MKYELADVMTAGEAEKIWSIKVDTLKKVCSGQRGYPSRFT
ncbi:helix-turn-helix domain-containing protein [Allisonella histaminiformans]